MNNKPIKLMLLGLTLIGIALFIEGTQTNIIYGNELYLALIGAIISIIGFFLEEWKWFGIFKLCVTTVKYYEANIIY